MREPKQKTPARPPQDGMSGRNPISVLQGMADDSPRQQAFAEKAAQLQVNANARMRERNDGLPKRLRQGIEALSGVSMDGVRVHRNSSRPAQLNAHAYAQGNDIHLAPGQEEHLPHEAWHVVQQRQGRVKPTVQAKADTPVNDDPRLEAEADAMAATLGGTDPAARTYAPVPRAQPAGNARSVVEISEPMVPDGLPAQLLAIANVVVFNYGNGARVQAINFAERVPTNVSKGQGDHGVAEVLIQESISILKDKTIPDFLNGLKGLALQHLEGLEVARHTTQMGEVAGTTRTTLLAKIHSLVTSLDTTPPENLPYLLSELTTEYWRLLEKRADTAFDRREGLTTGGGQEKAGIDGLRRIKTKLHDNTGENRDYRVGDALDDAIIYTPFLIDVMSHAFSDERLERVVTRAVYHVADFLEIPRKDYEAFANELTAQVGYSYRLLEGQTDVPHFGLKAQGNVSDMRDDDELH